MFRDDFKYYKSRNPQPDLSHVVDFSNTTNEQVKSVLVCNTSSIKFFGLIPLEQWRIYQILDNPGLVFLKNPFTGMGQRYWISRCLCDYTKKPNKLNLDVHGDLSIDEDWWIVCQRTKDKNLLEKLRWATLGYHHNWDTKVYSETSKTTFPADLSLLCAYIANALGYRSFKAEAAIVNYYHMDSTLSGHTDHSESNLEAPLFSFSFGQSAIFLLGGQSKDVKPTAMYIDSGDIVIMSKESRLCYHGVPKIVPTKEEVWINTCCENVPDGFSEYNLKLCKDDELWEPFEDYLKYSRININVRQVLNKGQKELCS